MSEEEQMNMVQAGMIMAMAEEIDRSDDPSQRLKDFFQKAKAASYDESVVDEQQIKIKIKLT